MKPTTHITTFLAALCAGATLALAGCGGSSQGSSTGGVPERPQPRPTVIDRDTAIELGDLSPAHAMHAPVTAIGGTLRVGPDIAPQSAPTGPGEVQNGATVRTAQVHDGSSRETLFEYLVGTAYKNNEITLQRPTSPPVIAMTPGARDMLLSYIVRGTQIINAALPVADRMTITDEAAPDYHDFNAFENGFIYFRVHDLPEGVAGRAESTSVDWVRQRTYITIDPYEIERIDTETTPAGRLDRSDQLMAHIVHELIHAYGADDHPDPERIPESVIAHSLLWNPGDVLYPIDRDILTASTTILGRLLDRDATYDALGAWNRTSSHLIATMEHGAEQTDYGVRTRHGFADAWAEGPAPRTTLAANASLTGTATWTGGLVGYTPDERAIAGHTSLAMDLTALTGDLAFTSIEYRTAGEDPSPFAVPELRYAVAATGNRFVSTSGDDGAATGVFTGTNHEAMAGIVSRTDLTAAFGGTR